MNRHGKHRYVTLVCKCGYSFQRQYRRVKKGRIYCNPCRKRQIHRIKFWPTAKLKEVIYNEGQTDYGTDYFKYIDEIKEVLYLRENDLMEKELNKRIQDEEHERSKDNESNEE